MSNSCASGMTTAHLKELLISRSTFTPLSPDHQIGNLLTGQTKDVGLITLEAPRLVASALTTHQAVQFGEGVPIRIAIPVVFGEVGGLLGGLMTDQLGDHRQRQIDPSRHTR